MDWYYGNIENETLANFAFRKVIFTGKYAQIVLMSLKPNEEIGSEIHNDVDQFFRFEAGVGKVEVGDKSFEVKEGDAILIPAGTRHNIINTSPTNDLKIYTLYSPPNHPDGTIHQTKAEADASHH